MPSQVDLVDCRLIQASLKSICYNWSFFVTVFIFSF
jgi:hypothetical protein